MKSLMFAIAPLDQEPKPLGYSAKELLPIPREIWGKIFSYLGAVDLCRAGEVNKEWHTVVHSYKALVDRVRFAHYVSLAIKAVGINALTFDVVEKSTYYERSDWKSLYMPHKKMCDLLKIERYTDAVDEIKSMLVSDIERQFYLLFIEVKLGKASASSLYQYLLNSDSKGCQALARMFFFLIDNQMFERTSQLVQYAEFLFNADFKSEISLTISESIQLFKLLCLYGEQVRAEALIKRMISAMDDCEHPYCKPRALVQIGILLAEAGFLDLAKNQGTVAYQAAMIASIDSGEGDLQFFTEYPLLLVGTGDFEKAIHFLQNNAKLLISEEEHYYLEYILVSVLKLHYNSSYYEKCNSGSRPSFIQIWREAFPAH